MGDDPGAAEHLACDAGVDGFVPVGEGLVRQEEEESDRGEHGGECGRGLDGRALVEARVGFGEGGCILDRERVTIPYCIRGKPDEVIS